MYVRNCLRSEETKDIFYTTEKSNCTEITALFFLRCGLLDTAFKLSNWVHDYRWSVHVPRHPTKLDQLCTGSGYRKIKFVRCPYDRAVSVYFQYSGTCQKDPRQCFRGSPRVVSFFQFLTYMEQRFKTLTRPPIAISHRIDTHYNAQSMRQETDGTVQWDHVIHVEDMDEELPHIGIHELPQLRDLRCRLNGFHWKKDRTRARTGVSLSDVQFDSLDMRAVNYADMYNDRCRLLVEKLYRIDFQCHPEYTWEAFLRRNSIQK